MTDKSLFMLILVGLVIVLVLVVAVVLIFSTSKQRILKEVSIQQKRELDHKEDMLRNTVDAQEKERARIAQELHDEIGSKLNVVNMNLNLMEMTIINKLDPLVIVDQIQTSLKESIVQIRNLSHGLYPPILEKFGLQRALNALAIEINKTGQIKVDLDIEHDWGKMSLSEELNVYRICQELINNTIKHAKAENIMIRSQVNSNQLILSYTDDGVGFDNIEASGTGMGMRNLETRSALLNGTFKFSNRQPSGVLFEFSIPFKAHK